MNRKKIPFLAIGLYTRAIASCLTFILLVGIVIIHAESGWFVRKHGNEVASTAYPDYSSIDYNRDSRKQTQYNGVIIKEVI